MNIENISRTGLLVAWRGDAGPFPLPVVGQMVTVEVELPANHGFGPKCIHCQGVVARVVLEDRNHPRVGVRLNYMDFREFSGQAVLAGPDKRAQSPPPIPVKSYMA